MLCTSLLFGGAEPLQLVLEQQVVWLSLEEVSGRPWLDPLLKLLTQPVRPESEVGPTSRQILRQLNRRCGPLSPTITARIEALPLDRLEALLDFQGAADLEAWLARHA
jgi:hypothetical protein